MQAMADDTQQDAGSPADPGRARRAPPTIDLEATEVTTAASAGAQDATPEPESDKEPQAQAAAEQPSEAAAESSSRSSSAAVSPWVIAPFSGAVAAALVIAVGWMLGWPQVQPQGQTPSPAPQVSAAAVDDLAKRVAAVEAKLGRPSADPALAARVDALDKSVAAMRGDEEKLGTAVNALKSASQDNAGNVDLSALNDRIAQLEQAGRAQAAALAQENQRIASVKAADDVPLRRVVAAALLDVAVRHGDPYQSTLAAAKPLAKDADELKPLDQFAATGVPNPPQLSRELLTLIPKLSPAPQEPPTTARAGILDRLQAGAAKLVRVERTDATGNDRGAIVARATSAALHNDLAQELRELNSLPPGERAPVQGWLDKVTARDAALSASRQFADEAMAALAESGQ
jgi:hypothetical protein